MGASRPLSTKQIIDNKRGTCINTYIYYKAKQQTRLLIVYHFGHLRILLNIYLTAI